LSTQAHYHKTRVKRVYYLSMEYLIGRLLDNIVVNFDVQQEVADACADLGLDYDTIRNAEWDAGLGNGGLGRLLVTDCDTIMGFFTKKLWTGFKLKSPICGFGMEIPGT